MWEFGWRIANSEENFFLFIWEKSSWIKRITKETENMVSWAGLHKIMEFMAWII